MALVGTINAPNDFGLKNRIINGGMQIWQRGTSLPSINGYCADRWFTGSGVAAPNVARVAGPTGYQYAMQITGVATNTVCAIGQRIESVNCADLVGQNITISANIAVSSAQTIVWFLYHPTASDNFNAQTQIATGTWSATTTATTFTATVSNLPSGVANGLQVQFYMNNGGAFTSGTFTITGVQIEKGSVATSFDYRPYTTEQLLCQRYYHFLGGDTAYQNIVTATYYASTDAVGPYRYPVEMRISPTISKTGTWTVLGGAGTVGQTVSADQKGVKNVQLGFTGGASGVSGQSTVVRASNDINFRLTFDAEL